MGCWCRGLAQMEPCAKRIPRAATASRNISTRQPARLRLSRRYDILDFAAAGNLAIVRNPVLARLGICHRCCAVGGDLLRVRNPAKNAKIPAAFKAEEHSMSDTGNPSGGAIPCTRWSTRSRNTASIWYGYGVPNPEFSYGCGRVLNKTAGSRGRFFQRIPQPSESVAFAVVVGNGNLDPTGPTCFGMNTGDGVDLTGPEFEIGSEAVKIMKTAHKTGSSERALGAPQRQETGFKPKVVIRLPRNPLLARHNAPILLGSIATS
jgi:hypothetical protein